MTPLKAIRAKCLDCCCNQLGEVKLCPVVNCSLHPFRFGKNPNRAGITEYVGEVEHLGRCKLNTIVAIN